MRCSGHSEADDSEVGHARVFKRQVKGTLQARCPEIDTEVFQAAHDW